MEEFEVLPCGCAVGSYIYRIYREKGLTNCPFCGSYLVNTFLGEEFPKNFEDSPIRIIFREIIYDIISHKIDGKFIEVKEGPNKWGRITEAIQQANVCFFDVTKEIFNVGIELGYALGKRKIVLLGSSEKMSDKVLSDHWVIYKTPPLKKEYLSAVRLWKKLAQYGGVIKSDIEKNLYSVEGEQKFSNLDEIIKSLLEGFRKINFPKIYKESYSLIEGLRIPKVNNLLVLTSDECKKYFEKIKKEKIHVGEIHIEKPDEFLSKSLNLPQFVRRIFKIIENYGYIVGHLLGAKKEENLVDNYMKHNFKVALLTGFFRGIKGEGGKVLFIKSRENTKEKTGLSFSDVSGDIDNYQNLHDVATLVEKGF